MRVTVITHENGEVAAAKSVRDFGHDADALTEIWRLLAVKRGAPREISWQRSDGVVVPHAVLAQWAGMR